MSIPYGDSYEMTHTYVDDIIQPQVDGVEQHQGGVVDDKTVLCDGELCILMCDEYTKH